MHYWEMGVIGRCEQHCLKASPDALRRVLRDVLVDKKTAAASKRKAAEATNFHDEVSQDSSITQVAIARVPVYVDSTDLWSCIVMCRLRGNL